MAISRRTAFAPTFLFEPASPGRYIRSVVVLLAAFVAVCAALLIFIRRRGELPPPPLTDEMAFNEKAQFLKRLPPNRVDIVVAGSSITLNDLSSDALLEQIPSHPGMVNIAAWSMKISETRLWLHHVMKRFGTPKLVLICLFPIDFQAERGWYARADGLLDGYLGGSLQPSLVLANFSLVNFLKLSRQMKEYRTSRRTYDSVDFDSGGSVPMDINYPNVDMARWNYVPVYREIIGQQYEELDGLAAELRSEGVLLVCVYPPVRRFGKERENAADAAKYRARVSEILKKNGQTLLDLESQMDLDDSYFADSIHLNARGASLFSQALGRELASTGVWSSTPQTSR
jgi:hypothetical protein